MSYFSKFNPGGAIADFRTVYQNAGPGRWRYAVVAALCTSGLFWALIGQSWTVERRPPTITYINSWPADRTAAETAAFIADNQRKKDLREAQDAAAAKEAQKLWMAVGRASGIDVDEIKKKADADAAAAKAKAKDAIPQPATKPAPQPSAQPAVKAPVAR